MLSLANTEPETCTIGRWRFDRVLGTLSDGHEERRLEHRAVEALAFLCHRRGDVVSRQDLLDHVWNGRAVSPNSVAVVIGDIRRALDEDARTPKLLITIAKRGYRLEAAMPDRRRRLLPIRPAVLAGLTIVVVLLALLSFALVVGRSQDARPVLLVDPVRNETGLARDAPLAVSLGGLVIDRLARDKDLVVTQASTRSQNELTATDLNFSAKLVLWNGLPTLHMLVVARGSRQVVWSGMAVADEDHIASATIGQLDELQRQLKLHRREGSIRPS